MERVQWQDINIHQCILMQAASFTILETFFDFVDSVEFALD